MSSHISVKGSLYAQDIENGKTSNNIPFEIYSDYSVDDPATYFRQLHFSNVYSGSTFMGISNVGTYFYMSAPSTGAMTEQSNTFIVTSGGNVGIGKTDPSDRLHVEGNALVRGSSANVASASVSDNIYASNVMMGDGNLVVDGNANHRIPSGTIALWEDSTPSTIPDGWVLFNALGTRFIRGSTSTGAFGGANTVNITISNVESHSHNVNSKSWGGNHSHDSHDMYTNTSAVNHSHLGLGYLGTKYDTHTHDFIERANTYANKNFAVGNSSNHHNTTNFFKNTQSKGHTHSISNNSIPNVLNSSMNHNHNYNSTNFNSASWTHTENSYETSSTGNNINAMPIIPPYKSYVFIIKL